MLPMIRKGATPPALDLRRTVIDAPAIGGQVTIRELLRPEYLAAERAAITEPPPDTPTHHPTTGARLLYRNADRWHAHLVAAGAIDPDSGDPLWSADEILRWPNRDGLWSGLDAAAPGDIPRLAQAILDLSEVGPEAIKSEGPSPAAAGPAGPDHGGDEQPGA